ncbi:FadR family transcriptional regulator [Vineibacter terrae]|uniref:FadR family transcriptional regulator n=1 Tax=Vineibacter terrae TaxID=2586908 RepID=A0A5C8PBT3_9HYPH|nr:FadR/GntR family transcriptional regulator [Vineibacter terrae]TXL71260.1 FadR family transcriptional regulator [Vineibacter terrae]
MTAGPQSLRPLQGGRKSDQVFERITALIRSGEWPTGSKLPPERELAALLNTSRPTVREAIHRAELVGLIEVRHGTGSFVMASAPRTAPDRPMIELIRKEAHRVSEFFEIRRALEGWCAMQAARAATAADLKAMKACLDTMRRLAVTDAAWEANDIAFHSALAAATGNPLAIRIMETLREGFAAFYRFKRYVPNQEDHRVIWQHHVDIYDGVRRRDPAAAHAALIAHMDFVEEKLGEGISGLGGKPPRSPGKPSSRAQRGISRE